MNAYCPLRTTAFVWPKSKPPPAMRTGHTGRGWATPSPSRTHTSGTSSRRPSCRPTPWPIGTGRGSSTSARASSASSDPSHSCPLRTLTRLTRRPLCGSTTPVRHGSRYGDGEKPPTKPLEHGSIITAWRSASLNPRLMTTCIK
ncbi:ORFC2 [Zebra finch circovirus]|uniref:ORFC2 n=1 Tax=Zebra finch circovirus TaxID=1642515 RepID=A0A0E3Z5I7_9CIRC|nr:ORFC2 [Zebra finch circovirus]AKC88562.1 ORFC2 [Zebra finch circovirus]